MPGIHWILLFVHLCHQLPVLAVTPSQEEAAPQSWGEGLWSKNSQGMRAAAPAAAAGSPCMLSFCLQSIFSFIFENKKSPPTVAWMDSLSWKKEVAQDNKWKHFRGGFKGWKVMPQPQPHLGQVPAWCGAAPTSREGREWGPLPPRGARLREHPTHLDSDGRWAAHTLSTDFHSDTSSAVSNLRHFWLYQ